jgi:putative transposase
MRVSNYRRPLVPGGTFFFTVVSYRRRPILTSPVVRRALHNALAVTRHERPFDIVAMVLLPDHLHAVWTLPEGDADFSARGKLIKVRVTVALADLDLAPRGTTRSRRRRQERDVWQRRFWDHAIRDDEDFRRHVDYAHWNPVKHKHVSRVKDWPHSTFHRYVSQRVYAEDWGLVEPPNIAGLQVAGE